MSLPTIDVGDEIVLKEVLIDKRHKWFKQKIKDLNLDSDNLIVMIKRNNENIIPNGEIVLDDEDLVVIYSQEDFGTI